MPHQFMERLEGLKDRVSRMTALVQQEVEQAVDAVLNVDVKVAQQVIAADKRVDEEEVQVEKSAIDLLALYHPAAGDLRLIAAIVKANNDFERIADCAVNIAQRVLPVSRIAGYQAPDDVRLMATSVLANLRDAIKAFNLGDPAIAQQVLKSDDVVDALYNQIVQDTLTSMQEGRDANVNLATIMIAKNLERIADHCTNIAEDVIYVNSGRIIRHQHTAL